MHGRQLTAWERAGLISHSDSYSFEDLAQLRTLREMRATRISAKSIRRSVAAMQRVAGMRNPLIEASAVRRGSRLAFRHGGALVDPVTQQLAFDFEVTGSTQLRVVGRSGDEAAQEQAETHAITYAIQELFQQAVQCEEEELTMPQAIALYEEILSLRPGHASASINLGTIYYNRQEFARSEELYRQATLSDPEYALAFFDLGNVLDELKRLDEAVEAYQRAVALVPHYADAHYNLALAYERQGEQRRALRHWVVYVRLDPVGPWASYAKGQVRRILSTERLAIVTRRGKRVATLATAERQGVGSRE